MVFMAGKNKYCEVAKLCQMNLRDATNSQSKYEQEFLLCKLTGKFYKFTQKTKMQKNVKDYHPKYTTSIYNEN